MLYFYCLNAVNKKNRNIFTQITLHFLTLLNIVCITWTLIIQYIHPYY